MAGEVSYHCSADDDAEAVGDPHQADCGQGFTEGVVGCDGDFGFGIDDVVFHRSA